MDIILQGLDNVASIQNDNLIRARWRYLENVSAVLKQLDDYGVRHQLNKCKFMQKSVTYMGCVISAEAISPMNEKVEAIKKAPRAYFLRTQLNWEPFSAWSTIRSNLSIRQPLNQLLQSLSGPASAKMPST